MKRSKRQKMTLSEKKKRKVTAKYLEGGGGKSKYARKHAYCSKHGVWGFEVPFPKPWQKKIETAAS